MAFGVVALCVVVLFYGVTYRTTRSAYAGWWCASLVLFLVSALLFLGDGTPVQVVTNPIGNTLGVLGVCGVWAAARSLCDASVAWWQLALAPAVVMVASFLDDPAHDVWTGGPFYLAGMAIGLGLAARQLFRLLGQLRDSPTGPRFEVSALAVVSAVVSVFYLLRAVVFVAVGPDGDLFKVAFGSQTTTLLTMVLLVVATFSMSELSHVQVTSELREQATHDGLTGTLNRNEFLRRTDEVFERGASGVVMVADLDGFKALNDGFGHHAGDHALRRFADICRAVVGERGLVGRLGGDEFAVLLPYAEHAEEIAEQIAQEYARDEQPWPMPTVSFGVAPIDAAVGTRDTIVRADVALYQAKAAGRDRVVRYDGDGS